MNSEFSIPKVLEGKVYHKPRLNDHTLDENELERTCPLDIGRHHVEPRHDLGALDGLPLETVSAILVQLDLRSLIDFRRVSQRAMQVIDSIPQFRAIIRHSLSTLRGILSIETGSYITCQQLYHTVTSFKCEECDDFAGFISVLDCSRACLLCFSENPRYLPLSSVEVLRSFGLKRSLLASVAKMRSVPGCYSPNEKTYRTRLNLIDPESARRAAISFYGSALAMEQHLAQVAAQKLKTATQPPILCGGNTRDSLAKRFMAIVRAPSVKSPVDSADWGFHCLGCQRHHRSRPLHWRRKYNAETFENHIQQCGPIIDGQHQPARRLR